MQITAEFLTAAHTALTYVQDHAKVRWADEDGDLYTATLRGWLSREDNVFDRTVRTTSETGMEDSIAFADLADLVARYRIARDR